ncbi:hypothetical protein PROFUN_16311, partial [Planoprotostelium fungivorum]
MERAGTTLPFKRVTANINLLWSLSHGLQMTAKKIQMESYMFIFDLASCLFRPAVMVLLSLVQLIKSLV